MVICDGPREYELYEPGERWTVAEGIRFRDREDAFEWLIRHCGDTLFIPRIRRIVAGHAPLECFLLSDREALEVAAAMLCSGRLALTLERERQPEWGPETGPAEQPAAGAEFERRSPPVAKPNVADPPTFLSNVDPAAQAGALVAAAQAGAPFCPM